MFPIRDTIPSRNYPIVNNALIAVNVLVYLVQLAHGNGMETFTYLYGLVPARYTITYISSRFSIDQQILSLFSFMFLHGGFWHLLGNMWSLYIFGDNVEDRLGPFRYLLFYLLCGFTSGLTHVLLNYYSNVPTIGASGAVAGVMGAYFLLHPRSKILTLFLIIIIPLFVEIPSFFFLGLWFLIQLLNASAHSGAAGGIAWWAHIGGFVFGVIFLKLFLTLPAAGMSDRMRRVTGKKKTHRLQVIHPTGPGTDPHLYGTLIITPFEARTGTQKLINIPWGSQKRLYRVLVPPDIKPGSLLRLKGLGKITPEGKRGDLLLRVEIQNG